MATEAALAFISYGFNELRLNSIEASERLMKRLNMEYDYTIQNDLFIKGKYRDTKTVLYI